MAVSVENRDFLYLQVQDWLLGQIRLGKLKPGSRLPGERSLAEMLKISRSTARLALQKLEKSGTIERIPSKGAFISTKSQQRKLRLAFLFSEAEISLKELAYSNWASSSEIQRGALSGCGTNNATLTFQYVADDVWAGDILQNLTKEYDGALFIGEPLRKLRQELLNLQFPCFTLSGEEHCTINYDRNAICYEVAEYLYNRGCRQVYMIAGDIGSSTSTTKINALRRLFELPDDNIIEVSLDEENSYNILKKALPADVNLLPDAFFCGTQVGSFALLRLAQERGWRVPEDFMIMGYANNMAIRPTTPTLTHVKIPYFEIGRAGAELFIQSIIKGTPLPDKELISAELIIGKTTQRTYGEC
ncbi:MAG: LacI family transcriptional regulator [Victivallaceae bacterium]|nr:LacI family transcriptional regulator [Victivallaceae bacterium]